MGVAFSQAGDATRQIVIADVTIPADDSATAGLQLITQLDSVVQSAGWVKLGVYGNGFIYRLTSPQGFAVNCRIYTPTDWLAIGSANPLLWWGQYAKFDSIAIQFVSTDGLRVGIPHPLIYDQRYDADSSYTSLRCWVNCCSLFTWRVGRPPNNNSIIGTSAPGRPGWCIQGGIPFALAADIDPTCDPRPTGATDICTEIWFSTSDEDRRQIGYEIGLGHIASCFRNTPAVICPFSVCYSGQLRNRYDDFDGAIPASGLRLQFPIPPRPYVGEAVNSEGLKWFNGGAGFSWVGEPGLWFDPALSWSISARDTPRVYGILYDAILNTANAPFEYPQVYGTNDETMKHFVWFNYMHNDYLDDGLSHLPSLYLLQDSGHLLDAPGSGNFAY